MPDQIQKNEKENIEGSSVPTKSSIPKNHFSVSDLAELTGINRKTVGQKLKLAACPYKNGDRNSKLFDAKLALPIIYNSSKEAISYESERASLTKAKREKAEIELALQKKSVVKIAGVVEHIGQEYSTIKAKFRALPSSMAQHLATESDPKAIFTLLSKSINNVLSELAADAQTQLEEIEDEPVEN